MPIIYEGGEGFEGLVNRRAFMFGTGHYLAQLSAIDCKVARERGERSVEEWKTHKVIWPISCQ